MINKKKIILISFGLLLCFGKIFSQCFSNPGNPIGGAENMGVMAKYMFRGSLFYKYSFFQTYYQQSNKYTGNKRILKSANYNYSQLFFAYGISEKWNLETDFGYFLNKTQRYILQNAEMSGHGLSNLNLYLKRQIYFNPDSRFEIATSLGGKAPLSNKPKEQGGVVLPIDLQPSTQSFGVVWQNYFVKENSFTAWRFFLHTRIEHNFVNPNNYLFGTAFSCSGIVSKHFTIGEGRLNDLTAIFQIRDEYKLPNYRNNNKVEASGSHVVFVVPQINLTSEKNYNFSLMIELPVYKYYNKIQFTNNYGISFYISRDIRLKKYHSEN